MPWKIKSESNVERVWVEVDAQGFEVVGSARIEPIISTPELVDLHVVPASVAEPAVTMVQAPQVEVPAPVPEIAVTPAPAYIAPAYVPPVVQTYTPVPASEVPPMILAPTPTPVMPLYEAPPANAQPLGITIEPQPNVRVEGNRVVGQSPTGWTVGGPTYSLAEAVFPAPTSPAPPTRRNFAWPIQPSPAAVGGFVAGCVVGAFQLLAHFL